MKTFFITGCSRGIGLGLAHEILTHGNKVIAACRHPADAKVLNTLAHDHEGHFSLVDLDVGEESSIARLPSQIAKLPHIDVLINNAGIGKEIDKSLADVSMDVVAETFRVNTMGPMRVTQALLPLLQKSSQPIVVQISSSMGSVANADWGAGYAYRISKAALNMFNKTLSLDQPNMICVVCHPGWVKTDMGGQDAQIDVKTSACGLYKVIRGLRREDSGQFFDYAGNKVPW